MWDRMIQAEIDYRFERATRGRPVRRRRGLAPRLGSSSAQQPGGQQPGRAR